MDADCFLMFDLLADYLEGRGSTMPNSAYQGLDQTNINRAASAWRNFYQGIRNANIAIERIPNINEINESDKDALIAEAKFLRALSYYYLVRLWGPVPIYLKTETEDIGRKPVDEVYQAIINDLQAGETDLPSIPAQFGHPTKWSAKAFLADVYLTIGEWSLAKEKAQEVIDSDLFDLIEVTVADDFDDVFGPNVVGSEEEIFYFHYNAQEGWGRPHKYLWPLDSYSNRGSYVVYCIPGPFFDNWDDNDLRKQFNIFSEYINRYTGELETLPESWPILVCKYRDPNGYYGNDWCFLRFADVLLIYAEAAVLADDAVSPLALECLNKIKRRAYGYPFNSVSPVDFPTDGWTVDSFRDTVIIQRAYELFMEGGKRWFDLKRTGTVEEVILANTGRVVKEAHLLWPIPEAEIDLNPYMSQEDQNPGY